MKITKSDGSHLPENHHLDFRAEKGDWRMKVTVNSEDPRMVGKRIFIPLHTKDADTARMMRDVIFTALHRAGVLARKFQVDEGDNLMTGDADQDS